MILRVTMQIADGALGKVEAKGDHAPLEYTGNHVAVFECQVKTPPALSLIDHSFKEYVLAHRMNFANWKLVDLDNYMHGNPYFSAYVDGNEWEAKLELATKDKIQKTEVKGQAAMNELRERMELYNNYLEIKEPKSNLRMPIIKSREREEAANKAKEAAKAAEASKKTKGKKEAPVAEPVKEATA